MRVLVMIAGIMVWCVLVCILRVCMQIQYLFLQDVRLLVPSYMNAS